jgi:hypothetical protein
VIGPPFNAARSDAQHKNAARFHGCDYVLRKVVFDFNQIPTQRINLTARRVCVGNHRSQFFAIVHANLGESPMIKEGFSDAVAVWLGLAFAVALSLFTTFAFGGLP